MTDVIRRGDLRVIAPPPGSAGDARLCLVLAVHTTGPAGAAAPFVELALVHPHAELATSMDAVVPGTLCATPYDIVVQADLRGVVWATTQVGQHVGRITTDTFNEISGLLGTDTSTSPSGVRVGLPLGEHCDRRWEFKVDEGRALDALTSDCTSQLIDDHARVMFTS